MILSKKKYICVKRNSAGKLEVLNIKTLSSETVSDKFVEKNCTDFANVNFKNGNVIIDGSLGPLPVLGRVLARLLSKLMYRSMQSIVRIDYNHTEFDICQHRHTYKFYIKCREPIYRLIKVLRAEYTFPFMKGKAEYRITGLKFTIYGEGVGTATYDDFYNNYAEQSDATLTYTIGVDYIGDIGDDFNNLHFYSPQTYGIDWDDLNVSEEIIAPKPLKKHNTTTKVSDESRKVLEKSFKRVYPNSNVSVYKIRLSKLWNPRNVGIITAVFPDGCFYFIVTPDMVSHAFKSESAAIKRMKEMHEQGFRP